jgi:hypothetical protein
VTVIGTVPDATILDAGIVAVRTVEEPKLVVVATPFQLIVAPLTKLEPFAVRVKLDPPAAVEVGEIDASVGTGFEALVTVKFWLPEVPPPGAGFTTVTSEVVAVVRSDAGIVAVSDVADP